MPRKQWFASGDQDQEWPARPEHSHSCECLWKAIDRLEQLPDRRLKDVVIWRYFGDDGPPLTFLEIGQRLGISDERARQLCECAIPNLRRVYETLLIHSE